MNGKSESPKPDKERTSQWLKKIFIQPWPYWVGGVLLAVANIIYVAVSGKYWAITTGLARWGAWILEQLGVSVQEWAAWDYYDYVKPLKDRYTWSNLGIIIGALLSILLARQFKWKLLKDKKQFFLALSGGWLMGYGARVASGCNIGGLYSAISSFALSGWIYLPFMVLGIWVGSKILYRWFL